MAAIKAALKMSAFRMFSGGSADDGARSASITDRGKEAGSILHASGFLGEWGGANGTDLSPRGN